MILDKEKLRRNLDEVIWKIEQARIRVSEHHIVQLVGVGKYTQIENIATLYHLGQRAYGENQVQQLAQRMEQLDALPIQWHMIGTLQKNKINKLIDLSPTLFHSLDSLELAVELNKKLQLKNKKMDALLQINTAKEETKSGVSLEEAYEIYCQIKERMPHIQLRGVMSIGANTDDSSMIQKSFEQTYRIFEKVQKEGAKICSMGMSGDYEMAIACGSNMVRVGSALFRE